MLMNNVKNLIADLKTYIDSRIELVLLNASEKLSDIIADTVQQLATLVILFVGIILALFGLSYYIADLMDSNALGFTIVSGGVLLIGFVIFLIKPTFLSNRIKNQFVDKIIGDKKEVDGKEPESNNNPPE